jgi:hypothetical protein
LKTVVHFGTPGVKLRDWHAMLAGRGSWHYPIFADTARESPANACLTYARRRTLIPNADKIWIPARHSDALFAAVCRL